MHMHFNYQYIYNIVFKSVHDFVKGEIICEHGSLYYQLKKIIEARAPN